MTATTGGPEGRPKVVVCAWCRQSGRPDARARPAAARLWLAVSHAFVRAVVRAGFASHGLCAACRSRFLDADA